MKFRRVGTAHRSPRGNAAPLQGHHHERDSISDRVLRLSVARNWEKNDRPEVALKTYREEPTDFGYHHSG